MAPDPQVFRDLAYVFVAAVLGGAAAWLGRQPLILGYVVGGILIGPFTPGPTVSDLHVFEVFAEIGVVLLMFSIGIEFSFADLLRVKWVALLGAPLGITLSAAVGLGVGTLVGWTTLQGVAIGIVVSVASTMVLARLLTDRGELRSAHGQVMIGITLVEDLAVVVLTVLLPVLGTLEPGRLVAIGTAVGMGLLVLVPFAYLAARVVPRAFLAGLMISGSEHEHQTLGRLLPLRDVFVALFFVTIGALIDVSQVAAHPGLLATIVGLIVVGKLVVWTLVVWLFRYPFAAALRVAVGLTQIGEFSFILVQVARTAGHVGDDVYSATLAASLVTILLNALLVRGLPGLAARALPEDRE